MNPDVKRACWIKGITMEMPGVREESGPFSGFLEDGVRYTNVVLVTFDVGRDTLISPRQWAVRRVEETGVHESSSGFWWPWDFVLRPQQRRFLSKAGIAVAWSLFRLCRVKAWPSVGMHACKQCPWGRKARCWCVLHLSETWKWTRIKRQYLYLLKISLSFLLAPTLW